MTQFLDLNDDILHEIFKCCQSSYDDEASSNMTSFLAQLRLLCHRFSAIIPRYMFQAIEVTILDENGGGSSCALLKRTMIEKPQYAAFIQKFHMIYKNNYKGHASGPANALLERLPNVRTLEIQCGAFPLTPHFLQVNKMPHLRVIEYSCISAAILREFMSLPSIRSIRCSLRYELDTSAFLPGPSPVHALDLLTVTPSASLFTELLSSTTTLRTLACSLPGEYRRTHPTRVVMQDHCSPSKFGRVLALVSSTLVNLDLGSGPPMRQISAGHDGSRLDLRTFVSLANIKIPFYYLFKSPAPHESRNGAYELFPHSMETLDIYFGLRSSLLHTADEDREKMIGPHAAFEPWTYEWIIQFAHNKHRCFPKLWRLNAEEDTLGNPRTESLVEWSGTELQTKSMREIWDSAGISGTISFRRFPSNRSVRSLIHQSNPRADI